MESFRERAQSTQPKGRGCPTWLLNLSNAAQATQEAPDIGWTSLEGVCMDQSLRARTNISCTPSPSQYSSSKNH